MKTFLKTSIFAFGLYLILTTGSGSIGVLGIGLWSIEEIFVGIIAAVIVGLVTSKMIRENGNKRRGNPLRYLVAVVYIFGPFMWSMLKANLEVAYLVLTGNIRPGIVRIESGLTTKLGIAILANSITLTPGTLTVDVDEETNDLFVHWIYVERGEEKKAKCHHTKICGRFPAWVRRITE